MADKKKKSKSRRDEDADKPSKEECAVAKYLRFGLETKEAKLVGMTVKYFIASEAVNKLMESKWATNKNKQDNLFTSRQSCVAYLDRLLNKGMFHRALRLERKRRDEKERKKKEGDLEESQDDKKLRKRKKEKKDDKSEDKDKSDRSEREETEKDEKKEEKSDDKKKKEKKVKLRMHDDQVFLDGENVYVWIYDPVNIKTFIIGLFMVLGTIGLCLFPLWPPVVRQGVYYCSLAGAVFVGFILFLAVVRFILFCMIWVFTGGKHHFWFLPNLTEDVGFFDSFKPLYTHSYKGPDQKTKKDEKKTDKTDKTEKPQTVEKKEKEKSSDKEETKSDSSDNDGYEIVDKSEVTDHD